MSMDQTAIAVFDDKEQADAAVRELNSAGFLPDQIAVARQLTKEEERESDTAEEPGAVAKLAGFFGSLLGFGGDSDSAHEADFQAGRTIVRVKHGKRKKAALEILFRHGGYNHASRSNSAQTTKKGNDKWQKPEKRLATPGM